ncbi:MAG: S41 family peptidase [Clostridia bacterium]|nr:S41 family peptidase [Clostridia bacterium]
MDENKDGIFDGSGSEESDSLANTEKGDELPENVQISDESDSVRGEEIRFDDAADGGVDAPKKQRRRVPLYLTILLILAAVLLTFELTFVLVGNIYREKYNDLLLDEEFESELLTKLYSIMSIYDEYFIGEIDEDASIEAVLDAYVAANDKYGSYMTAEEYAEMIADYNAELDGIGVHVVYSAEYSAIEIVNVMPDSPALEAGLEPGDIIYAVEGELVSELGYYPAIYAVKGEKGTYVNLTILRDGEYLEFDVMRDEVTEQTVVYYVIDEAPTVGYIWILSFDNGTYDQFVGAVEYLEGEGCESLVLDVRNNPGGLLTSVQSILDYILPDGGPIVRLVDKDGNEEVRYATDGHSLGLDIVVICNGSTASAGELFTSAIKDYASAGEISATVIGVQTYGKGTVQQIMSLSDGSALSISYKLYSPPYSDNFEGVGVTPDVTVEPNEVLSGTNLFKVDYEDDNQLQYAVELLLGSD